ncbi:universal stress protein [mine drainage metagenome]|uniref:Universal stress protein n=1 Tax=mine drainage metagenome TaxID=410659 RepID=T1BES7_9ZZZZ
MYRHILVPVRSPPEVEPMIRFAASLLDADGEIRMLHVIPTTTMPQVTREWRASVNLVIPAHETAASLDVRVEPEIRASVDVPAEILESAEAHSADAILLSLGGDRRSRNPFVGHTASAILHYASADILVINRLALTTPKIPRILVPTLVGRTPPKAMRLAEEISIHSGGVPIVTLDIGSSSRSDEGVGDHTARGVPILHRHSTVSEALLGRRKHTAELILQGAARERYGLLLVGEDSHSVSHAPFLTRPFLEELFRSAPCPVVAIRG